MSTAVTFALPPARKPADLAALRKAVTRAAASLAPSVAEHAAPGCGCDTGAPVPCPKCVQKAWAQVPLGTPNDPLEAEAERVADALDHQPDAATSGNAEAPPDDGNRSLGRLVEHSLSGAPAVLGQALSEGGQALPTATRSQFESALGYDFSRVRVHAGSRAGAAARTLSSRAFTWGHHVAFAPGQYAPHSAAGRHLLAHELAHVVQQSGVGRPAAASAATKAMGEDDDAGEGLTTRCPARLQRMPGDGISAGVLTRRLRVQRDFALQPPRPAAVPRVLTPQQMLDAIAFNERVVAVIGPDGIARLRDVLGIARAPAVIDQAFVEAVQRWQAMQGLGEDGRLGPESAGRLFVEIGAEQVGRAELTSGPTYRARTTLAPPVDGAGQQRARFDFDAEFKNDPVNGIYASCGEVRQFIQWDAASAAALPLGGRPHAGFPAGSAADTWIEDRDTVNKRYGHRRGPHAESIAINTYLDTASNRNAAFGHRYHGEDRPGGPAALLAGHWRFFVRAFDVCNGNKVLGTDFLRITW